MKNILSRLRRRVKKRKQKRKNSKSGLDTGGYAIMPLKGKDLPFSLFWVSIFYTP